MTKEGLGNSLERWKATCLSRNCFSGHLQVVHGWDQMSSELGASEQAKAGDDPERKMVC